MGIRINITALVCIAYAIVALLSCNGYPKDGLQWLDDDRYDCYVLKDGTVYLEFCYEEGQTVAVPSQIEGYSVSTIGKESFSECTDMVQVLLPNTIELIDEGAFHLCDSLQSIEMSNKLTEIKDYAFSGCYALASIDLPRSLRFIGEGAFADCTSLCTVSIPNGVTSIGDWCFVNCSNLKIIEIPVSVEFIGENCFDGCLGICVFTPKGSYAEVYCMKKGITCFNTEIPR